MDSVETPGHLPSRSLLALVWTCFSVACFFVVLRTAVRLRSVGRFSFEDYWIFLALATLLTTCILQTIQLPSLYYMTAAIAGVIPLNGGLVSQGDDYLRYEFAIIGLFWTVLWCVKASFLALYYRLFLELPAYRRAWYALSVFTFCAYVGCWITAVMTCHPTINFFKFGGCNTDQDIWGSRLSVYYSTAVDVFTDLCIMSMPLRLIYNVRISMKQKAGLVCVFGLCIFMIVFAVIRAKQILDNPYFVDLTLLEIWSTLAATISVVVGSLPAFKFLIANRTSSNRSTSGPHASNNSKTQRIPLGSFSNEPKPAFARRPSSRAGSQEEMLKHEDARSIVVKNDVTVSYGEMERPPPPIYQTRRPIPNGGRPF